MGYPCCDGPCSGVEGQPPDEVIATFHGLTSYGGFCGTCENYNETPFTLTKDEGTCDGDSEGETGCCCWLLVPSVEEDPCEFLGILMLRICTVEAGYLMRLYNAGFLLYEKISESKFDLTVETVVDTMHEFDVYCNYSTNSSTVSIIAG